VINIGMNKYLVTLRLKGQLVKTAVYADSTTHAQLICEYQFGMGCLSGSPTQMREGGENHHPLLDDLMGTQPPSAATIKPTAPKPKAIKPKAVKPLKPQSPEQMRISNLKANVDRQKDALRREKDNQRRQREAEHRWRNLGGI